MEDVRKQEREEEMFRREELPGRFTTKKLFRWSDKRYNEEYLVSRTMWSGSRVAQSGVELLQSGGELTTKVGEQPWP